MSTYENNCISTNDFDRITAKPLTHSYSHVSRKPLFQSTPQEKATYYKRRECITYVDDNSGLCAICKRDKEPHHSRTVDKSKSEWNYKTCTMLKPTDAYGVLTFPGSHCKTANYIRVQNETKPKDIIQYLYSSKSWNLQKPQLILSVTGGAQKFTIPYRMKKAFKSGLIKAAASTGAWIITGGTNTGVMRLVGEAVADEYYKYNTKKLTVLGIATWGIVEFREKMIKKKLLRCGARNEGDDMMPLQSLFYAREEREASEIDVGDGATRGMKMVTSVKEVALDPNHTHFILVDDGSVSQYGKEIEFRAHLEAELRKGISLRYYQKQKRTSFKQQKTSNSSVTSSISQAASGDDDINNNAINDEQSKRVPMILIVVQGGPNTLLTVEESLKQNVPVLVLADSKGCADLIANACLLVKPDKIVLEKLLDESKMIKNDKEKTAAIARLEYILSKLSENLINVFRLDSEGCGQDIELTILRAFLNSRKNQYYENLKLALQWNRSDIAKTFIFTGEEEFKFRQLAELMEMALLQNKHEFVELLLENGLNLNSFLTQRRLYFLYNSQKIRKYAKKAPLFKLFNKRRYFVRDFTVQDKKPSRWNKKEVAKKQEHLSLITFKALKRFIKDLLYEDFNENFLPEDHENYNQIIDYLIKEDNKEITNRANNQRKYVFGKETLKYPEQNLFFWALLMNRIEIARIFWKIGQHQIANALFASNLLKSMSMRIPDFEIQLRSHAEEFERMAIGVLNIIDFNSDDLMNSIILLRKLPIFQNMDCLEMAVEARCLKFVSLPAVQTLITEIWNGNLSSQTGFKAGLKMAIGCFSFGLLAPFLVYEHRDRRNRFEITENDRDDQIQSRRLRVSHNLKFKNVRVLPYNSREAYLLPLCFKKAFQSCSSQKRRDSDDEEDDDDNDDDNESDISDADYDYDDEDDVEEEEKKSDENNNKNFSSQNNNYIVTMMETINESNDEQEKAAATHGRKVVDQTIRFKRSMSTRSRTNRLSRISTYWHRYKAFVHAPRVHFINESLFFVAFLIIFSYMLLCKFGYDQDDDEYVSVSNMTTFNSSSLVDDDDKRRIGSMKTVEYLLIYWIFSFIFEEIYQYFFTDTGFIESKYYRYFENKWNYYDLFGCLTFLIGMAMRYISIANNSHDLFTAARIVLAIDLSIWYLRLLHVSIIFKSLGPKLIMIQKMVFDLAFFLIIIAIFVCSFGVTTQATLYPGHGLSLEMLKNMLNNAYWPIYGEMKLLDILNDEEECKENCPETSGIYFSYIALMIYMITANILLVNLLIAMFSSTFQDVQDNTDEIWRFQRYRLVFEYRDSSIMPAPLNCIAYLISVIDYMSTKLKKCSSKNNDDVADESDESSDTLERKFAEEYLRVETNLKNKSNDSRLKYAVERLDFLEQKMNEITEMNGKEVSKMNNAINWIMTQMSDPSKPPPPYLDEPYGIVSSAKKKS